MPSVLGGTYCAFWGFRTSDISGGITVHDAASQFRLGGGNVCPNFAVKGYRAVTNITVLNSQSPETSGGYFLLELKNED